MRGSCLCGRIQYKLKGPKRTVVACHCIQCRKTSGHYVAATQVAAEHLELQGEENITWFTSSEEAKRGFCKHCGSQLFWRRNGSGRTSVMAGTIDGDTGLVMDTQIHPDTKGDYYDLPAARIADQSEV